MGARGVAVVLAPALALALAACTVVSGIDDYQVRKGGPPGDAGPDVSSTDASTGTPPGATPPKPPPPPPSTSNVGPVTCGADGSWTACNPTPTTTTCADACRALGSTCVESCCMYDDQGDFAAQVGLVYAALTAECSMAALPSTSSWGACTDPVVLQQAMSPRCCCK